MRRTRGGAGGFGQVMSFGKSRAKRFAPDLPKISFKDVAGVDEAVEELQEIKEFLADPRRFQALGARIPKGVLLVRPAGHGQDAARARGRRRGRRAVLLDLGLGLRRDVRRRRRQPRARPVQGGEGERRRASSSSTSSTRSAATAAPGVGGGNDEREQTLNQLLVEMDGFDAQPEHHPDRRDEPAGRPRPGAAAPGPLRPADRRRQARPQRPRGRSSRCTQGEAARAGHRSRRARRRDAGVHRRRARQPRQRGGAARGPARRPTIGQARARGGRRCAWSPARRRRARVHLRAGSARSPPTTRWATPSSATSSSTPTRCTRSRSSAAGQALGLTVSLPDRGPLPHLALGAARPARDDSRRAGGRGARLRGDHHRSRERPRAGNRHGAADDHPLRHERQARPARLRLRPAPALPRARAGNRAVLLRGDGPGDRRGDLPPDRRGAPARRAGAARAPGGSSTRSRRS